MLELAPLKERRVVAAGPLRVIHVGLIELLVVGIMPLLTHVILPRRRIVVLNLRLMLLLLVVTSWVVLRELPRDTIVEELASPGQNCLLWKLLLWLAVDAVGGWGVLHGSPQITHVVRAGRGGIDEPLGMLLGVLHCVHCRCVVVVKSVHVHFDHFVGLKLARVLK